MAFIVSPETRIGRVVQRTNVAVAETPVHLYQRVDI